MRAQLAFITERGGEAPALLLTAAQRLEKIDSELSRETYLDALVAAIFAGPATDIRTIAEAAGSAPAPCSPGAHRTRELLLAGTAAGLYAGYAAEVPILRRAMAGFGADMLPEEELRWMYLACITTMRLWDDDHWNALSDRYVELARGTGALGELPLATQGRIAPYSAMGLAALRGDEAMASELVGATLEDVTRRGEGIGVIFAEWANAALNDGLGRFDEAMAAGLRATADDRDPAAVAWPLVELIEAAARCGMTEVATRSCAQLAEMTTAGATYWALGAQARSRALLGEGEHAERLYREAIDHFEKTRLHTDLARAHLIYGEWLRREGRRTDAREQLRTAHGMLETIGMEAFAERAARELRIAGGTARPRRLPGHTADLTAQEAQIARMARDGLSNPEIGTRLFISARTVQYHLRKVFTKLDITSRSQLDRVLPDTPLTCPPDP